MTCNLIILDTDIGTDVDDLLALYPVLTSAELELVRVTTIVRTVMARPGEITLIAIGPLTNVALVFLREPRLAQSLAGLLIMGGSVGGARALHLPWTEHIFRCDPKAAHVVLSAGTQTWIVPLDITTQVRIRLADVERIHRLGDPFHRAVADQVARYPGFVKRGGWTYLHDPPAVATAIDSTLVTYMAARTCGYRDGRRAHGRSAFGRSAVRRSACHGPYGAGCGRRTL